MHSFNILPCAEELKLFLTHPCPSDIRDLESKGTWGVSQRMGQCWRHIYREAAGVVSGA